MEKTKVNGPNGPVDAYEMNFKAKSEPWAVYELEDGTTLRVRINLDKVYRIDGQYHPTTGDPSYMFTSKNDVRTQCPTKLKKFMEYPKADSVDVA